MFRVLGIYNFGPHPEIPGFILAFPTGWDSATFRDKGTEVPSLFWDKGTTGQAQNLAMGRDESGQSLFFCQNSGRDRDGTGQIVSIFYYFPVLEHLFLF